MANSPRAGVPPVFDPLKCSATYIDQALVDLAFGGSSAFNFNSLISSLNSLSLRASFCLSVKTFLFFTTFFFGFAFAFFFAAVFLTVFRTVVFFTAVLALAAFLVVVPSPIFGLLGLTASVAYPRVESRPPTAAV
jgi:hypothetical protein